MDCQFPSVIFVVKQGITVVNAQSLQTWFAGYAIKRVIELDIASLRNAVSVLGSMALSITARAI